MKKKFTKALMLMAVAVSMGTFVSCKDTDGEGSIDPVVIEQTLSLQDALNAQVEALKQQMADYELALKNMKQCQCTDDPSADIADLKAKIAILEALLESKANGGDVTFLKEQIVALQKQLNEHLAKGDATPTDLSGLIAEIEGLKTLLASKSDTKTVSDLQAEIAKLQGQLAAMASSKDVADEVAKLQAQIEALKLQLAGMTDVNKIAGLEEKINDLYLKLATLTPSKDYSEKIAELVGKIESLQILLDSKSDKATVESLTGKVNDLQTKLNNMETNYDALAIKVAKEEAATAEMKDAIKTLQDALAKVNSCDVDCKVEFTKVNDKLVELEKAMTEAKAKAEAASEAAAQNAKDIAALTEKFNNLNEKTQKALTDIQTNAEAIKNMQITYAALNDKAIKALEDAAAAKAAADLNANAIKIVNEKIAADEAAIEKAKKDIEDMKVNVAKLETKVEGLENVVKKAEENITKMGETVSKLDEKVEATKDEVASLKKDLENLQKLCDTNLNLAKAYTDEQVALIQKSLDLAIERIEKVEGIKDQVLVNTTDIEWLKKLYTKLDNELTDMGAPSVSEMKGDIATMKTQIADILNDLGAKADTATVNKIARDLAQAILDLNSKADTADVNAVKNDLATAIENIATLDSTVQAGLDSLLAVEIRTAALESTMTGVLDSIDLHRTQIATLTNAYKQADQILQNQINNLYPRMKAAEERINTLQSKVNTLEGEVSKINQNLAKMITSIQTQGTTNPWFGSVNLPFNVNTNVLLAFYGETTEDVFFPSASGYGPYAAVAGNKELTAKDMQMITLCNSALAVNESKPYIKQGAKIFTGTDGRSSAGTLYLTINPSTVACDGLQVNLENSQAVASGVLLDPLHRTDKVIQFGQTRAAYNGFYAADAYINKASVDQVQKINMSTDALKSTGKVIKEVVENSIKNRALSVSQSDVLAIANDMRDIIQNSRLDAYAVNCPWKDADNVEHHLYSEYKIAATAVSPLSFETFKDFHYETLPGYEKVYDFIDKTADKITGTIKDNVNGASIFKSLNTLIAKGNAINIEYIDVTEISAKDVTYEIQIALENNAGDLTYAGGTIKKDGVTITFDGFKSASWSAGNKYLIVTLVKKAPISDVYNTISSIVDGTEDQVETIVDFLKQVNKVLRDAISIKDSAINAVDKYSDKLVNVLQKVLTKGNAIIVNQINEVNSRLQPVLMYTVDSKTGLLSTSKIAPTKVNGTSLSLIPTTWTLELAMPVARKHVAVTNVYKAGTSAQDGDAACKAALVDANKGNNMNARLDGRTHVAKIENMKAGFIYEIAYSALDYHGMISTRKYYVKVD